MLSKIYSISGYNIELHPSPHKKCDSLQKSIYCHEYIVEIVSLTSPYIALPLCIVLAWGVGGCLWGVVGVCRGVNLCIGGRDCCVEFSEVLECARCISSLDEAFGGLNELRNSCKHYSKFHTCEMKIYLTVFSHSST